MPTTITSTFTPAPSTPIDNFDLTTISQTPGTYASGNDDPSYVVRDGVVYFRDLATGNLTSYAVMGGDPLRMFHVVHGTLTVTITDTIVS